MKISGYFPVDIPILADTAFEAKLEGEWKYKKLRNDEDFYYRNLISAKLYDPTILNSNGFTPWVPGAYDVRVTGEPGVKVSDRYYSSDVIKVNNSPFMKRVRRGDMVVSTYKRFACHAIFSNGSVEQTEGPVFFKWHEPINGIYALGFTQAPTPDQNNFWVYDNPTVAFGSTVGGSVRSFYRYRSFDDGVTPLQEGFDDSFIEPFLNVLDFPTHMRDGLITSCLASANRGTVDFLTALAEAPESVKSVFDGLKAILKLYTDAKKGHLSFLTKAKRLQRKHENLIQRAAFVRQREYVTARNARARRIADEKFNRTRANLRNDLRKTLDSFSDAVTSIWLNFRFNITPNVILVEDALEVLTNHERTFIRFAKMQPFTIQTPDLPGFTRDGAVECIGRVMIKRSFSQLNSDFKKVSKELSANFVVTLWELIPFSHIVDYSFNTGDYLASLTGNSFNNYLEASTISVAVKGSIVTYTGVSHKSSVRLEFKGYKRTVINPWSYCSLQLLPNFTPMRVLDVLAHGWILFTKDARKKIYH